MAVPYLGDFAEDQSVFVAFNTFSSDDPAASVTITNLADTDIHIHKDDGTTQHSSATDVDVQIDFDSITGNHMVEIRTTNAFFTTGADYFVRMEGTTVDAGTINAWIGHFSIENRFTNVTKVNGSSTAANNIEVVFDTDFATAYDTTNNYWNALLADDANHGGSSMVVTGNRMAWTSTSGVAADFTGQGANAGIKTTGGSGGPGFHCIGTNHTGIYSVGGSSFPGFWTAGGPTNGKGMSIEGGGTNGGALELVNYGTGKAFADGSNNWIGVDVQAISADETAAVNAESAFDGTGYNVGNGNIVAASVTGNVGGSVNSLNTQAKADVNAEVKDVLDIDTYAERAIAAGPPAANAPLSDKIVWLAMLARNRTTSDGSTQTLFDDEGTGTVSTSSISDAAGTTTRGEWS